MFTTLPIEIAEKPMKGLDCHTLALLRSQIPAAQLHYNKKCKPSNYRKDLDDYFAWLPTFPDYVLNKILLSYQGNVSFVGVFLMNIIGKDNWDDGGKLKRECIHIFTSTAADQLAQGRVNMLTINLIDFIRYHMKKMMMSVRYGELSNPILQHNEMLRRLHFPRTEYIHLENMSRYYTGRLVAIASKDKPTMLNFILYSDAYKYDQTHLNLPILKENLIIMPHEDMRSLNIRFFRWIEALAMALPDANRDWYTRMHEEDEDVEVMKVFIAEVLNPTATENWNLLLRKNDNEDVIVEIDLIR